MIYLLTAIGLPAGGSSTVRIYTNTHTHTQTVHGATKYNQYVEQHKQFGKSAGRAPVFAGFALAFTLQLRKKHGKTSVRVAEECQLTR
jgi:hypothetical protein